MVAAHHPDVRVAGDVQQVFEQHDLAGRPAVAGQNVAAVLDGVVEHVAAVDLVAPRDGCDQLLIGQDAPVVGPGRAEVQVARKAQGDGGIVVKVQVAVGGGPALAQGALGYGHLHGPQRLAVEPIRVVALRVGGYAGGRAGRYEQGRLDLP